MMPDYQAVLADARELSVKDRLRLIDELASTVPDNSPPMLSAEWDREIQRRSEELDARSVATEEWTTIREREFAKLGIRHAD